MSFRPLSMATKGVLVPFAPKHSVLWKEKGEALKPRILVKSVKTETMNNKVSRRTIEVKSVLTKNGNNGD
jgi:hypothetical protein